MNTDTKKFIHFFHLESRKTTIKIYMDIFITYNITNSQLTTVPSTRFFLTAVIQLQYLRARFESGDWDKPIKTSLTVGMENTQC